MKKIILCLAVAMFPFCGLSSKESMKKLTDRVFEVARQQMIQMDTRLDENTFPRSIKNGAFHTSKASWWCSGFYPGSLWYVYMYTGDAQVKALAEKNTEKLYGESQIIRNHDIGFVINCSYGNAYRITGEEKWRQPIIDAANLLTTRFNPVPGVIKSWNTSKKKRAHMMYPVIIDNMMNLEILTQAYKMSGNKHLLDVALTHADTTMKHHFRQDYTTWHVVDYDPVNGGVRQKETAQGYAHESAWARGQAWAVYGYTMMFRETGIQKYLDQAEHIARMLLERLPEDGIPYWDFDAPDIPNAYRDASAGAIMASAFLELSDYLKDKALSKACRKMALKQIRTLASEEYLAKPGENCSFLLKHSVGSLPGKSEIDVPLTYADYYYLEALLRYCGKL